MERHHAGSRDILPDLMPERNCAGKVDGGMNGRMENGCGRVMEVNHYGGQQRKKVAKKESNTHTHIKVYRRYKVLTLAYGLTANRSHRTFIPIILRGSGRVELILSRLPA